MSGGTASPRHELTTDEFLDNATGPEWALIGLSFGLVPVAAWIMASFGGWGFAGGLVLLVVGPGSVWALTKAGVSNRLDERTRCRPVRAA